MKTKSEIQRDEVSIIIQDLLKKPEKFHSYSEKEMDNIINFFKNVDNHNPDEMFALVKNLLREYDREKDGGNGCAMLLDSEKIPDSSKVKVKIYATINWVKFFLAFKKRFKSVSSEISKGVDKEKSKDVVYGFVLMNKDGSDGEFISLDVWKDFSEKEKKDNYKKFWDCNFLIKREDVLSQFDPNEGEDCGYT